MPKKKKCPSRGWARKRNTTKWLLKGIWGNLEQVFANRADVLSSDELDAVDTARAQLFHIVHSSWERNNPASRIKYERLNRKRP